MTQSDRSVGEVEDQAALIAALQAGEDAAFEKLARTHSGRLLAVARRMLKNEHDA